MLVRKNPCTMKLIDYLPIPQIFSVDMAASTRIVIQRTEQAVPTMDGCHRMLTQCLKGIEFVTH